MKIIIVSALAIATPAIASHRHVTNLSSNKTLIGAWCLEGERIYRLPKEIYGDFCQDILEIKPSSYSAFPLRPGGYIDGAPEQMTCYMTEVKIRFDSRIGTKVSRIYADCKGNRGSRSKEERTAYVDDEGYLVFN